MSKFITDKYEIIKSIKRIVESKSIISLSEEDFDDYEKIIAYHCIGLEDENSKFHYPIDKDIANKTQKILVNTTCADELTMGFIQRIISNIKTVFNDNVELIYANSEGLLDQKITIEIFLLKN